MIVSGGVGCRMEREGYADIFEDRQMYICIIYPERERTEYQISKTSESIVVSVTD